MENINISNKETTPKHFFLHIFTIIMLYFFTINLIILAFQCINILIPDDLSYYYDGAKEIIRFALASIIVIFPVFIISTFFLEKSYKNNPEVEKMKIKKWLIYFTVFLGSLVIISNLVVAVLSLLNGEITLRFLLKSLSLFIIIGLIITYYGRDIKGGLSLSEKKIWAIGISILFLIAIITGFFLIGSPIKERLRQFDLRKVENLSSIQSQVVYYYQKKGFLPEKLSELEDPISGFKTPFDPQTKEEYEYRVTGENSFEICSNFNLVSEKSDNMPIYGYNFSFQHGEGRECFERIIDKELYPFLPSEEVKRF